MGRNEKVERFKYNMDFEHAMRNLLGKRYYGSAGVFADSKICKQFLRRAIKRIKRRLNEIIVSDERLMLTTSITLDRLEGYVRETSEKVNNDWFIISNLLNLVALILGYDWVDGEVHRHVFFHQNRAQEIEDYQKKVGGAFWDEFPWGDWRIRFEMVSLLKERGLPRNQIGRVLGLSYRLVTKILKRIEDYETNTGNRFLEHSDKLEKYFFLV